MNVFFDQEQLLKLVSSLYALTGIRANILNIQGHDICLTTDHAPFCERINRDPEGHKRCMACDAMAVRDCVGRKGFWPYRCHVGIREAVLPIRLAEHMPPMAYLIYGQILDDTPLEEQWERTRALLDWWPGDPEELKESFFRFRQYSDEERDAYSEILETLAAYIQLKGMIQTIERTDIQKLDLYLDQHYSEKLTLASIAEALGIGRTKLCLLAKELSGGRNLSVLLTQRRIEAAKLLLLQNDDPISAVSEAVGFTDYNYFSKRFREVTGITPTAYRRERRGTEAPTPSRRQPSDQPPDASQCRGTE